MGHSDVRTFHAAGLHGMDVQQGAINLSLTLHPWEYCASAHWYELAQPWPIDGRHRQIDPDHREIETFLWTLTLIGTCFCP